MCILLERASEVGDRDDWVFYLRLEGVCVLVSSFGEVLWSIKSTRNAFFSESRDR
jgi:hypothetical protein